MANKKISELPYISVSKISGNTLVPLVTYFSATTGDTVHTYIDDFQTYLISGLTGNTDVFVTGGTYSAGTITFTNNTGGTFNITGLTTGSTSIISGEYLPLSGGTVTGSTEFTAGLSANTISATTYQNLPDNVTGNYLPLSGGTVTGQTFFTSGVSISGSVEMTSSSVILNTEDFRVYDPISFNNLLEITSLSGVQIASTNGQISSDFESRINRDSININSIDWENRLLYKSDGSTISFDWENGILTGQTNIESSTISATTYLNLPITTDVFVTGGTYSAGTSTFTNNTGGTFIVSGFVTGDTYVTGLTFNTGNYNLTIGRNDGVSFTDSLAILASDLTVTGGTYDPNTGEATFTNNTGGTFVVTGFLTGFTDTYVTGGTYSNGTATFTNTSGGTFNVSGFYTGATDVFVTGGTYSAGTITFTNNTGGTFNVTGLTTGSTSTISGDYLPLSGGTVTGGTIFQSGLTANTIYITGNTFDSDTDTLVFRIQGLSVIQAGVGSGVEIQDSIGNTVFDSENKKLLDLSSSTSVDWENRLLYKSGGTISFDWENGILTGQTNIQSSTISATTYQNLPISGLTEGSNINISGTNGNYTISVTGITQGLTGEYLPLSGGTVSGNTTITADLTVSGNSGINWFSSNTSSDLVRITQTGVGNAFVIEDNTNPDSTPFIINSGGSVSVGTTSVFSSGGAETKLNVSNGSSGVATTGLTTATPLVVESNLTSSIGMISPDNQVSQIYFGTPSDALGSVLRWDYTKRDFSLGTSTTSGKLIFLTGSYDEVARIDQSGNMGIGLTGATQKLEVSGNTRIYGSMSAQTGYISGSGQNILTVIGSGNSTTSPLFSVQGSSGELFSVTDSLTGSLFSVNDISGLPIMEVFSDNTTLWGSYQAPSLNTTTRTSLTAGTNTIYSIPTSAYTGAFFEYTLISSGATGARAGQIMSIWSGSTANFTETSTTDIGTTTGVTFTVAISGNNAVLSSSATTTGWTVKTIIRSI